MRELLEFLAIIAVLFGGIAALCHDPLAVDWSAMDAYVDSLEDKKKESDGIEHHSSDSE
jgi:hypothetical protein